MLPNLIIKLQNGGLGRVARTSDGVAGLILTGAAVDGKLDLNKVYPLASMRDLAALGVTEENNPLLLKDVAQFYDKTGDGAELYLLVVAAATTLEQICSNDDASPLRKLISHAKGRIRLVGINRLAPAEYVAETANTGIDYDAVKAGQSAHAVAESYASKVNPFRIMLPALLWDGKTDELYRPRQSTFNRVTYVMASDATIEGNHTAAIGQALGRAAAIPVHYSLARVKNGMATLEGKLTNGKTPEECEALLDTLHNAGYIIYRTFVGRNGYYFSDDPMAAPLTDDYSNLSLARVIDKAIILTYGAYIDEMNESVEVDDEGQIPVPICRYYEGLMNNAVASAMSGEISDFESFVDPDQNIISTSRMVISCRIRPKGVLRDIIVNLGFENPAIKQ